MSREEDIFQLLVESNPIPDVDDLDVVEPAAPRYLATLEMRSSEMSNHVDTHATTVPSGARRARWAWAAAAVIVIGIGVLLVGRLAGKTEPATDDSTSEQVAETFVNATEALDASMIDSLIPPDATATYLDIFGYHAAEPGSIQGLWEWGAIYDMTYTIYNHACRRSNSIGGPPSGTERTFFTCDYRLENDWTRAMNQAPMTGRFRMEISDGRIVWLTEDFPFEEFTPAWTAVTEWVQTEHPDDYSTMLIDQGTGLALGARLTPESMALWSQYNPQIVDSLSDSAKT